ncbi:hypothetical protein MGAS2111_1409 [Streptococcus pyogenes MGAS2111]|nr:hypothetical protein MGAS2111_1409 [Streptococcus pyogenes MGAS2111]
MEYTKAGNFMADGVTLKKVTMKSLEDLVTFEYQRSKRSKKQKLPSQDNVLSMV